MVILFDVIETLLDRRARSIRAWPPRLVATTCSSLASPVKLKTLFEQAFKTSTTSTNFLNQKLFPYLHGFRQHATGRVVPQVPYTGVTVDMLLEG